VKREQAHDRIELFYNRRLGLNHLPANARIIDKWQPRHAGGMVK
jgi:hypothetical protein